MGLVRNHMAGIKITPGVAVGTFRGLCLLSYFLFPWCQWKIGIFKANSGLQSVEGKQQILPKAPGSTGCCWTGDADIPTGFARAGRDTVKYPDTQGALALSR